MKLAGATYMDIHRMGGGIGFTVNHTRESTPEELALLTQKRFDSMLRHGTTLVEAKTGLSVGPLCSTAVLPRGEKALDSCLSCQTTTSVSLPLLHVLSLGFRCICLSSPSGRVENLLGFPVRLWFGAGDGNQDVAGAA